MADTACVLVVIKSFTYRGQPGEEWSNRYAFTGPTPADSTAWRALFDALVLQEKTLYASVVNVVRGYAYSKWPVKGDSAVWSVDLRVAPNSPVAGTFSSTGAVGPGDSAAWIRWGLNRMVKGKRVYLRKYYHPAYLGSSGGDFLQASWPTAASAFGAKLHDGTFLDGRSITDQHGNAVVGHGVSSFPTVRTLKRRGKRPPTTP